ncbi:hypothetical protein [Bradyrhizobium mercantei]|uniref:hypothetical protein n=1 Tax=Bradyrhizobium mercantei TaxID=1904807 RepID=UPI001356556D|nr:hypothetical protein [Bradyrhizobium mercantei]
MEPFGGDLVHFGGDGVIAVSSQAGNAGLGQEMSSDLPRYADSSQMSLLRSPIWMHRRGWLKVAFIAGDFPTSDTFPFLNGKPNRIDLLFLRCRSLELPS